MSNFVADGSSQALVPAPEMNMFGFHMALDGVPRGEYYQGSGLIQVITGLPMALLSGIFGARLAGETVGAAIEGTVARVASWGVAAYWWIRRSTRLLEAGPL